MSTTAVTPRQHDREPAGAAHRPGRHITALVVDDDPHMRDFIAVCMKMAGIAVTEADNGIACLEATTQQTFDIIFLDIVMPKKDGIETLIELRQRGVKSKIVIVSGHEKYGDQLLVTAAKTLGADHFVAKPLSPEKVLQTVQTILESARGAPQNL